MGSDSCIKSRVLLTGFTPFGNGVSNPSMEAVNLVRALPGMELHRLILPTVFSKSMEMLKEALEKIQPSLVICVGVAAAREAICLERIAINIDDAKIPDNDGNKPQNEIIVADGPPAYWSTLPCERVIKSLLASNIPAKLSFSAGTFVCNHVFYSLMHFIAKTKIQTTAGFVHIPSVSFLPLETSVRALEITLRECLFSSVYTVC